MPAAVGHGGARASSEARERTLPGQRLTGRRLWGQPEEGQRRRIWWWRTSVSCEESVTPTVIEGTVARFLQRGSRGWCGGPSQNLRGVGGCGTMALGVSHGGRGRLLGACTGEKGIASQGEREERGFVASNDVSRRSPRWPRRQAGGGHGGHLGAPRSCSTKKTNTHLQKAPLALGVSLENTIQHPFVLFGGSNLFWKHYEDGQGPSYKY
jgi:hypothetical protein